VLVVSVDALTDLDLNDLLERHRSAGGIATLTVKKVADTGEYGVVLHDEDGRITGFQEKPDPAEALSDLGNCGIYCFSPEIFDFFPENDPVDWANDVFPALLDNDVPFYIHETTAYWNDVGSLGELREGTWDVMRGEVSLEVGGGSEVPGHVEVIDGPVWLGEGCELGEGVRLMGPVAIGDGCRIGAGSSLRHSIVLPGAEVGERSILIGAITGHADIPAHLRPFAELG